VSTANERIYRGGWVMLPLSLPFNDQLYSNITSLEFARECININLRILMLNAISRHNVNMKYASVSRFFCLQYHNCEMILSCDNWKSVIYQMAALRDVSIPHVCQRLCLWREILLPRSRNLDCSIVIENLWSNFRAIALFGHCVIPSEDWYRCAFSLQQLSARINLPDTLSMAIGGIASSFLYFASG